MIGHRLIYWFVVFTPVTASELDEYEKGIETMQENEIILLYFYPKKKSFNFPNLRKNRWATGVLGIGMPPT